MSIRLLWDWAYIKKNTRGFCNLCHLHKTVIVILNLHKTVPHIETYVCTRIHTWEASVLASSYCFACDDGGCPMHAQNADGSLRRHLAGLSRRAPSSWATTLPAGDRPEDAAASGLSAMAPAEGARPLHERSDDGSAASRGEKGSSAACNGATAAVGVGSPLRSRLLISGSSQMRPDEPCRRNDTDDLCSLDIYKRM
jgi:hypothetical protein